MFVYQHNHVLAYNNKTIRKNCYNTVPMQSFISSSLIVAQFSGNKIIMTNVITYTCNYI